jgi:transposase-like protein
MAPKQEHNELASLDQDAFQGLLRAELVGAVRLALIRVLAAELSAFIGAQSYERNGSRRDRRNGHYERSLDTSVGHIERLPVPRTRSGFKTRLFERYARRAAELDAAIGAMFIRGVSTRGVGLVVEQLTGKAPSASTVSRVFHTLEAEFENWKDRALASRYDYCFADGTYFSVIYDAEGCKMPILALIGIRPDGEREVLAFSTGDRENQAAWEQLLDQSKRRGVDEVGLWITDGGQAMLNAIAAKFPGGERQRCVRHKLENILNYVPKKLHDEVAPELKAIFYQENRAQAEQKAAAFCLKYEGIYPSAVECLKRDLAACLTFYSYPRSHWKAIRTTNIIERLFEEVKRRSHKMGAAFNEDSCLLLFYAVVRSLKFQRLPAPA